MFPSSIFLLPFSQIDGRCSLASWQGCDSVTSRVQFYFLAFVSQNLNSLTGLCETNFRIIGKASASEDVIRLVLRDYWRPARGRRSGSWENGKLTL